MEIKPIKRNTNIVKLSKDHHASLLFCWKIRQGIKYHIHFARLLNYVQYFWDRHFCEHFKEEEKFLFAPYMDEIVQQAIDDHRQIKKLIERLPPEVAGKQQELLSQLADTVNEHVRYEERILFPHLEEKLSEEQLEMIGKQITDEPLIDNYEDNFWTKPVSL